MSPLLKKITMFCLVFFLCAHFLFIAVYSSPYLALPNKLKIISDVYVYPYFQQHWGLFVPAPKKEYHLYNRYKAIKQWSAWQDVFVTQQLNHRANVALGNESLVLLYSSVLNYAYYAIDTTQFVYTKTPTNLEFQILKHAIKQHLKIQQKNMEEFEIIVSAKENNHTNTYYFKHLQ